MSEFEPIVETVVETPVEEKIYKYQPVDDENRPIGGLQVIKYHTQDELIESIRKQNELLIRKLRQETRKNRLGIVDQDQLPDDVQKYNSPVEFNPRELTDDERIDISRRLMDPVTAMEATSQLIEARLGAPLDQLGSTLQSLQNDNIGLRAKIEANAFKSDNPDYYVCQDNFEAITSWIVRYNLAPVKDNFQRAYDTLKAQGALVLGPAIVVEAPPVVEQAVEELPVVPVQQEPVQRVSTGLHRGNSSSAGTPPAPGSEITYKVGNTVYTGIAALNAMPAEEYKRRLLNDKSFGKIVDQLEAASRRTR